MQKRTSGFRARAGWLAPFVALSMMGCPKQELAPLGPCTVSSVREDVNQTGISKVDLLFVIDNSASMASEQKNLGQQLPRLIRVLTTGDRYIDRESEAVGVSDDDRYFTPVSSLQLGVVSSELGVMTVSSDIAAVNSCKESESPDDGLLQTGVDIATMGQTYMGTMIAGNPACADVDPPLDYLRFDTADKTPDQLAEDAAQTALEFGCIATLGVLGCAYEQQLEAMWKAIAPSTENDFIDGTSKRGHGNPDGANKGFIRDDAILAVIQVTDEEDCSIKSDGRVLFESRQNASDTSSNPWVRVPVNLRCGRATEMDRNDLIQPVSRYIEGLKSLKAENPDRVIFAGLVGIPQDLEDEIAAGNYEAVLADSDMQFRTLTPTDQFPQPSCTVTRPGSTAEEVAYPGRRFVEVAAGFGENAALFSICRDDYGPAVDQIIDRIAAKLKGNCLPRQLTPDENGVVRCEVYELLPEGMTRCTASKGHIGSAEKRKVSQAGKIVERLACKMQQVPVLDNAPTSGMQGWYYDSFSESLKDECSPGEQQRIVFTDGAQLFPGAGATFECFQPVASITANSRGFDAINTRCDTGDGDEICSDVSDDDYKLICIEQLRTCQISCRADPECPPGWVCATINDNTGPAPKYCQQPTCQTTPGQESSGDTTEQ